MLQSISSTIKLMHEIYHLEFIIQQCSGVKHGWKGDGVVAKAGRSHVIEVNSTPETENHSVLIYEIIVEIVAISCVPIHESYTITGSM